MFFSAKTIINKIREKEIDISPFLLEYLGPTSYEMHLGDTIFEVTPLEKIFDGRKPKEKNLKQVQISDSGYILNPGTFIIAKTQEKIVCNENIMGLFDGKASLAQIGLFTNISSMLVEPGVNSEITCEIYNSSKFKIKLYLGQKIGQIFFATII